MHNDGVTLWQIAQAAELISDFVKGFDKERFLQDAKTQSAVLHKLLVVGEAVKRLSSDFRVQNPQIPWSLIAGMRDKLVHAYDTVDLEEVWKTATVDIPDLLQKIQPLLPPVTKP